MAKSESCGVLRKEEADHRIKAVCTSRRAV